MKINKTDTNLYIIYDVEEINIFNNKDATRVSQLAKI